MTINSINYRILESSQAGWAYSRHGLSLGSQKCARIAFDQFDEEAKHVAIYQEGKDRKPPWYLERYFTKCTLNGEEIWIKTRSFCKRFSCPVISEGALKNKLDEIAQNQPFFFQCKKDVDGGEATLTSRDGSAKYVFHDQKLGQGSFKTAKIAKQYINGIESDDVVVLIVERDEFQSDETWRKNCQEIDREIQIMKELKDRGNFLQLLGYYKLDGSSYKDQKYYIVVPKGKDMLQVVQNGEEKSEEKGLHSFQMAKALSEFHDREWIHRDVKLANFIRLENGNVVLCDFGATCRVDDNERLLDFVSICPSPEQAKKFDKKHYHDRRLLDSKCTTQKADSWALGLALYELHHRKPGTRLIQAFSPDDVRTNTEILTQAQINVLLKFGIPDVRYRTIIQGLLQVDPENRMSTANAATQLEALISKDL